MQINVTRPVVVSTATGLRHFMPGLLVDIPQVEAEQILRQQAGNSVADRSVTGSGVPTIPLLDDATRKKKPQGLAPREPEKAQSAAIQTDPALLADALISAESVDFGGDSCGDSAGGE